MRNDCGCLENALQAVIPTGVEESLTFSAACALEQRFSSGVSTMLDMTGLRTIRPLTADDAEEYAALRRESLLDAPLAFTASPEDDKASSAAGVREMLSRGR